MMAFSNWMQEYYTPLNMLLFMGICVVGQIIYYGTKTYFLLKPYSAEDRMRFIDQAIAELRKSQ